MVDASNLIPDAENTINDLLFGSGTSANASSSAAGSTPTLSGANQPQAPSNGQGATTSNPVNYVPWIFGAVVLIGVIIFAVRK